MISTMILDFELRSKAELRSVGAYNYAAHPSTEVLCMAYKIDHRPTELWEPSQGFDIPKDIREALDQDCLLEAHNSYFEYSVWNNIMHRRHGWPSVPMDRFRCTAARSAQFALPRSLEDIAQALGLGVQKDAEGRRIMLQVSKPKKPSKKDPREWYEDEDKYARLYEYCKKDVDVTYAIRERILKLSKMRNNLLTKLDVPETKELEVFKLNNKINEGGVYLDKELAEKSLVLIEQHSERLNTQLAELTDGAITSATQAVALKQYINDLGFGIPNLRSATVDKWIAKAEGKVLEILKIRQALSMSSVKKIRAMLDRAGEDLRIRDLLVYYGASRTGRFSGIGIQVQNFARPTLSTEEIDELIELIRSGATYGQLIEKYPNFLQAISSCLRGMLRAEEGNVFYDSDFSAIEARVLFWLADEEIGLETYRQGKDIYKEMASVIYDKPIHEITKDDRTLGKTAVLGLGYSMSAKKFKETCERLGTRVSEELATKAVSVYRDRYSNVVNLWKNTEKAAIAAILQPGKVTSVGRVKMYCIADFLFVVLPSGRALAYHKPTVTRTPWGKFNIEYHGFSSQIKKYEIMKSYGGKLVENIVQATARDFMTEAMLRAEDKGYSTVFTVHDQLVAEVPEDFGSVEEYTSIMKELPEWGAGCPIDAETDRCYRFKK